MDPKRPGTHYVLGGVYAKEEQDVPAVREFTKFAQLRGEDSGTSPWTAYAYALAGKRQEAFGVLED
jgi:hypothetical protein